MRTLGFKGFRARVCGVWDPVIPSERQEALCHHHDSSGEWHAPCFRGLVGPFLGLNPGVHSLAQIPLSAIQRDLVLA